MVWDRWIAESVSFNFKTKLSTIVRDLPLNFTSNGGGFQMFILKPYQSHFSKAYALVTNLKKIVSSND